MTTPLELKRLKLPAGFEPDLDGDPGYCYTHCYSSLDKRKKMAYIIGLNPLWSTVCDKGGFDNVRVIYRTNPDGSYHIAKTTGAGFMPWLLPIPPKSTVGMRKTTWLDWTLIMSCFVAVLGLPSLMIVVPALCVDYEMERTYVKAKRLKFTSNTKSGLFGLLISLMIFLPTIKAVSLNEPIGQTVNVTNLVTNEDTNVVVDSVPINDGDNGLDIEISDVYDLDDMEDPIEVNTESVEEHVSQDIESNRGDIDYSLNGYEYLKFFTESSHIEVALTLGRSPTVSEVMSIDPDKRDNHKMIVSKVPSERKYCAAYLDKTGSDPDFWLGPKSTLKRDYVFDCDNNEFVKSLHESFVTNEAPIGFEGIYHEYLKGLGFNKMNLCMEDARLRSQFLKMKIPNDHKVSFLQVYCPGAKLPKNLLPNTLTTTSKYLTLFKTENHNSVYPVLKESPTIRELKKFGADSFVSQLVTIRRNGVKNSYCPYFTTIGDTPHNYIHSLTEDDFVMKCDENDFYQSIIDVEMGRREAPLGIRKSLHEDILVSLDPDKTSVMCITDDEAREELFDIGLSDYHLGLYADFICPGVTNDDFWSQKIRLMNMRARAKRVKAEKDKSPGDMINDLMRTTTEVVMDNIKDGLGLLKTVHDRVKDDTSEALSFTDTVHNGLKRSLRGLTENVNDARTQLEKGFSEAVKTVGTVTTELGSIVKEAVENSTHLPRATINKANNVATTVTDETINTVEDVVSASYSGIKDFTGGLRDSLPSATTMGSDLGNAVTWSYDTSKEALKNTGKVVNSVMKKAPDSDEVMGKVYDKLNTSVESVVDWTTERSKEIGGLISKDGLTNAAKSIPDFTEGVGKAAAGPVKGAYKSLSDGVKESVPEVESLSNYTTLLRKIRVGLFGEWPDSELKIDLKGNTLISLFNNWMGKEHSVHDVIMSTGIISILTSIIVIGLFK